MSKCQQWVIASICTILSLFALYGAPAGRAVHAKELMAFHLANQKAGPFVARPVLHNEYIDAKGASAEGLAAEERALFEEKRMLREMRRQDMQRLLASRSIHLEQYAKMEQQRIAREVASSAVGLIGKPYVWGGTNPQGFDCSGFTQYVYSENGTKLPRNSYDQFNVGKPVPMSDLQPGDLVFFTTYAPGPSHLGIYIGDGKFVHALNHNTGVITSTLDNQYYKEHFVGAKRVL